MAQPLETRDARLESLARELEDVRRRLAEIERALRIGAVAVPPQAERAPVPADELPGLAVPPDAFGLAGRALLVLCGAYLLRALTDSGALAPWLGVAGGLSYAAFWLFRAHRVAAHGARGRATLLGLTAALIACPLVVEAMLRLGLLPAPAAALALLTAALLVLAVARAHGLQALAWGGALAPAGSALVLQVASHDLLPFSAVLVAIAGAVEALSVGGRWPGLRWPTAFAANLGVLYPVLIALRRAGLPEGYAPLPPAGVAALAFSLAALYVASIALRTLHRARPIVAFELLQASAALAIGFFGAARVLEASGHGTAGVGALGVSLGLGCYLAAFAVIDRRTAGSRNFYAYTTLGGVLTLAGSALVAEGPSLAYVWCGLALLALALGARFERMTLCVHGALYLAAAAVLSGLLGAALDAVAARPDVEWRALGLTGLVAWLASAAGYALLVRHRRRDAAALPFAIVPLALLALLTLGAAALAVRGTFPLLSWAGAPADAGILAALRTALVACAALGLAWGRRRGAGAELAWLAYALLALGGLKLLAEDFPQGRPLTLFVALAFYGGALVAAPRLLGRES